MGSGGGKGSGGGQTVIGLGNFHKSLQHNEYGEVAAAAVFATLTDATAVTSAAADSGTFKDVNRGTPNAAPFVNPLAGLARDPLVPHPETFTMPPPPAVSSVGTAAEMIELYWMALLRDVPFDRLGPLNADVVAAVDELNAVYGAATQEAVDGSLREGVDLPHGGFSPGTLFRIGLPGEEFGPLISQFFIRDVPYGTQTIDQRQDPYRRGLNFLTTFPDWLSAQNSGRGVDGEDYRRSNERHPSIYLESPRRFISCMRDLARFVNKDALHQAYFNAALQLLNGGAMWTPMNPYFVEPRRDIGFGALGGPHILALASEVATRALQTVWYQKWQKWLRLRPEAYGGHLHVQEIGVPNLGTKNYGLKATGSFGKTARDRIRVSNGGTVQGDKVTGGTLLLPMAFTAGSPMHPSYGAGHATVAGACVTVLKAFFRLLDEKNGNTPLPISTLANFPIYAIDIDPVTGGDVRRPTATFGMTIEGELNKLAMNVAMGRSMGGVHWRTDNTRSLMLGEAMAAHVLSGIAHNVVEKPTFVFRTFGQRQATDGMRAPRLVEIGPPKTPKDAPTIKIDGTRYKLRMDDGKRSLSNLVDPPDGFKV
jgi:hypothetical protein